MGAFAAGVLLFGAAFLAGVFFAGWAFFATFLTAAFFPGWAFLAGVALLGVRRFRGGGVVMTSPEVVAATDVTPQPAIYGSNPAGSRNDKRSRRNLRPHRQ